MKNKKGMISMWAWHYQRLTEIVLEKRKNQMQISNRAAARILNDIDLAPDYDAPEDCGVCGGVKLVVGRLGHIQHLQCRDCGIWSHRPVENGVVMNSKEEYEEE